MDEHRPQSYIIFICAGAAYPALAKTLALYFKETEGWSLEDELLSLMQRQLDIDDIRLISEEEWALATLPNTNGGT